MISDHHGRTAGRATLLVRAVDDILGTHRTGEAVLISLTLCSVDAVATSPVKPDQLSTSDIREGNVVKITRLLRERGALTRAELVRSSGLTRPTVMAIVQRLLADGLVTESGQLRGSATGGRPGSLLHFRSQARVVAAVRWWRGTHVEAVLADVAGNVLVRSLAPRVPETLGWTSLVTSFAGQIRDLHQANPELGPLASIAVSLPGSVDRTHGLWTLPRRPAWHDLPLGDTLAEAAGVPVAVVNVVAAALIGQLSRQPAHAPSAALVYVAKGVGAAATVNGRLIDGATGSAGELGHCTLSGVDQRCRCGRHGCVEAVTSSLYLRREYRRITGRTAPPTLAEMETTGNDDVLDMLETAASRLALATSWLVNILNPAVLYFGGNAFTHGASVFPDRFTRDLRAAAHQPNARDLTMLPAHPDATIAGGIQVASELLPDALRPALRVVR